MDLTGLAALRTPSGAAALTAAAQVTDADPLVAATALRAAGIPGELAAAALTQARLRRRAIGKFGPDADRMFFTSVGLEQATRESVARRRAERLWAAGVRTLADLGCGLGADALAAARVGIRVYGVESDPLTAAMAAANAEAAGLADRFTVTLGEATATDVTGVDAVFCDPARRRATTGRRVFDPSAFSPPWDFLVDLVRRVPRTVIKTAPGIDHALIPAGAEGEWVSVGGDLVEATLWCGPLAEVPRRATLLPEGRPPAGQPASDDATPDGTQRETQDGTQDDRRRLVRRWRPDGQWHLSGTGERSAPVGPIGRYLFDPDPAVVRAGLVAEFAETVGGRIADPSIAYVYTDAPAATPFARCLEVTDVLPFALKRLRALLRDRAVGQVEILKRGSAVDVERLRRDLRLSGPNAVSLVLTRVAGAPTALLCRPVLPGHTA